MKDFRTLHPGGEAARPGALSPSSSSNHTSDEHDWFQARPPQRSENPARANWYVWSDTDQKYLGTRIIFTDTEKSNWTWDPEAGQFYWHRFFSHQPDLNFRQSPRGGAPSSQVMKRWLDTGVDGFSARRDPLSVRARTATNNENLPETHAHHQESCGAELDAYAKGKVLLAEANQWPEGRAGIFSGPRPMNAHMALSLPADAAQSTWRIAQEDRFPDHRHPCGRPRISRPIASGALFLRKPRTN